jgi:hypothetical protein
MSQQIITLIDFIATLPQKEHWYIRDVDHIGVYFHSVAEQLEATDQSEPHWHRPVRVLWNEAKTVVIVGKAIPADENPDRKPLVLMHQSAVYSK